MCHVSPEPSAELKRGLTDSTAFTGEEFSISVELSAVCSGFWSLGGRLLRSGGDYLITRSKNTHTLLIRNVTMEMNGAELKFVGGGSQTSCTLNVKGMPIATVNKHHQEGNLILWRILAKHFFLKCTCCSCICESVFDSF